LLIAAVLAVYLVTILGAYRRSGWTGESDWRAATDSPFVDTVVSGASGELVSRASTADGSLAILSRVPDEVPLLYGESYLAVVTLPVPHVLWPEKPGLIDGRVGSTFFRLSAGVPAGAVGEAYWNFHIAGVIGVFFLFGLFHAWLARTFVRYGDKPAAIALYASCLLFFREPGGPAFVVWMLVTVPLLAILVYSGALGIGGRRR
jgi:hypothetical protein